MSDYDKNDADMIGRMHTPPEQHEKLYLSPQKTNESYIPPEQHEKMYLSPENAVKGQLRRTFGNPTPVALGGFLMANTPATIDLMGWRGAGAGSGNAAAGVASYMLFGGLLLILGGIGEFILGNTFPSIVFCTFGGFWLTFGGTLYPAYGAVSSYSDVDGFYDSFAHFLLWMSILCLLYMICALRTNILLVTILFVFVIAFPLLAASYWYAAEGKINTSDNCRIAGGAFAFTGSIVGWYLFASLCLEAVDFPLSLPVGDLSTHFPGKSDRRKAARAAARANNGNIV